MAVAAYPAPPHRLSCAPAPRRPAVASPSTPAGRGAHLHPVSLGCSSSSRWWPCRRRAHPAVAVARRRRPPRAGAARVSCAYSAGAETITACSWNEYVICSDVPVLIMFWASWCGPCKMVHRVVEEIAQEYAGRIKCYKLDTDDYPQIATSYNIERVPTVLLFKDGEKLGSITGTLPKSVYVKAIEKSLS